MTLKLKATAIVYLAKVTDSEKRGRQAGEAEEPTVRRVSQAIYEALKESDPDAFIRSGVVGGRTTVDGRFDLRFVAARLLRRFGTTRI